MEFLRLTMSPAELIVRGTLMYWFLFLVLRFILRRDTGNAGISDILFVVLLGDAAQNGMIGDGETVGDAVLLISVLVAWNYVLDFLGYHVRFFEWLTDPPPICLIRDGRVLRRNMRREHLTDTEIEAKLRGEGIDDVRKVKRMFLESDGSFSVLRRRQSKS
jgi:uncharacterized membrane protein YcaP (DUF421 family)